ncbi:MAG: class I adenylate-forming enzyme family protein [Pseudomonadota bacterium]
MNLASLVKLNATNHPNKPAIFVGDDSIAYGELWSGIESIATQLHQAGITAGDRVALSMADHAIHIMSHYAVARLGAVIVPVDHRWTEPEKQTACHAFSVKLAVTDDHDIDAVTCITVNIHQSDGVELPPIPQGDHDLLISLSSGTTGKPKGAIVTHEQFLQRFVSQWAAIGIDSNDCFAIATPLFFGAGRSFAMCLLTVGGQLLLAPPPIKPEALVEQLNRGEVSATFLPPTLLRRLLPLSADEPLLPKLNYLLVSGEPLHSDEAQVCLKKISPNLVGYYASSEGGGISVLKSEDFVNFSHTVGLPTYRTEVQIVDSEDRTLDTNQVGRLRYRGPGVATRFVDSDGQEKNSGQNGWFYPGDLAERLPTGHIVLRGRDKDVIIRGGVNVYPAEIEAALVSHQDVQEVCVLGIASQDRGEKIVAFVCGDNLDEEALVDFCKENLAPYKVPESFVILGALPKSNSGKVDKGKLKKLAET